MYGTKHCGTLTKLCLLWYVVKGQEAYEAATKTMKLCLCWCQLLWGIQSNSFICRCCDQVWWSLFEDNISTLVPWHMECNDSCCRSFNAEHLPSTTVLWFKSMPVDVLCSPDLMVVHYFIPLHPAACCVTCSSILICSATRYSFSALLHLIRTDCVPPNNGIMTGTHWFPVLVLSASWPSAGALEWESLLTQMWPSYKCKGLLVFIEYPHGLWRGLGLVGTLTVKCVTWLSILVVPKLFHVKAP